MHPGHEIALLTPYGAKPIDHIALVGATRPSAPQGAICLCCGSALPNRCGSARCRPARQSRVSLAIDPLGRIPPDWNFGSMEVNALFVAGKIIKPAARAFTDFLIGEARR